MQDYEKQARGFLIKTGVQMTAVFLRNGEHFPEDKDKRDIYQIILSRESNHTGFSFAFGTSIRDTEENRNKEHKKKPDAYDVLCAIQKTDPGTIDEFADDYGYRDGKPSILQRTYRAVWNEWKEVSKMFTEEELAELIEIQ